MNNSIENQWKKILDVPDIYIYGAKRNASYLYDFIKKEGYDDRVDAFVVSEMQDNPSHVRNIKVLEVDRIKGTKDTVLITQTGNTAEAIKDRLEKLDIHNYYEIGKLLLYSEYDDNPLLEIGLDEYNFCSEFQKAKYQEIRERILHILGENQPYFGALEPYQSLEKIGLKGVRPSTYRIKTYGIEKYINEESEVLDIGCNLGFLDISISNICKSVYGIEYEQSLVDIANMVCKELDINNLKFHQDDFNDWYAKKYNLRKYDMIFCFAIHHWLRISQEEFVERLNTLLNINGYICIESHIENETEDIEYSECINQLTDKAYHICNQGTIEDMPKGERRFAVLQKG